MELAWEDKGRGGRFVCPYHGWLFGSQGELVNVPAAECFPHLNKKESGLRPIACEEYEGFIFLNLDPEPRQSLEEFLGPIGPRLKGRSEEHTSELQSLMRISYAVFCLKKKKQNKRDKTLNNTTNMNKTNKQLTNKHKTQSTNLHTNIITKNNKHTRKT